MKKRAKEKRVSHRRESSASLLQVMEVVFQRHGAYLLDQALKKKLKTGQRANALELIDLQLWRNWLEGLMAEFVGLRTTRERVRFLAMTSIPLGTFTAGVTTGLQLPDWDVRLAQGEKDADSVLVRSAPRFLLEAFVEWIGQILESTHKWPGLSTSDRRLLSYLLKAVTAFQEGLGRGAGTRTAVLARLLPASWLARRERRLVLDPRSYRFAEVFFSSLL